MVNVPMPVIPIIPGSSHSFSTWCMCFLPVVLCRRKYHRAVPGTGISASMKPIFITLFPIYIWVIHWKKKMMTITAIDYMHSFDKNDPLLPWWQKQSWKTHPMICTIYRGPCMQIFILHQSKSIDPYLTVLSPLHALIKRWIMQNSLLHISVYNMCMPH